MHGRTVRDAPVGGFPATGHPTLAPAREPVRLGKRIKRKDFSAISDSNGTAGALARSDAAVKARDANGAPMAPIYLRQMLALQNGWKQTGQMGRSAVKAEGSDIKRR
jgi:hypothetical protein